MRNTTFVFALVITIVASGVTLAQSRGHRCEQKKNDLNTYTLRLSSLNIELAPIDQEIDRLNRRIQELREAQQQKINERNALQESVRALEEDMDRVCRPYEARECLALENRADNLRGRAHPLNERMNAIRNDIQNLNQEVADRAVRQSGLRTNIISLAAATSSPAKPLRRPSTGARTFSANGTVCRPISTPITRRSIPFADGMTSSPANSKRSGPRSPAWLRICARGATTANVLVN